MYNLFAASACMIKREVAIAMGGFHQWWGVEDLDLWVRVLELHTAICSPAVTVLYHVHGDQVSSNFERMHRGHREVAGAHLERTGAPALPLERWEATAAWDTMRALLALHRRRAAVRQVPGFLRNRQRIIGLIILLWSRFLTRRRSAEIGRDGAPSFALLVREPQTFRTLAQRLDGRSIRDLSHLSLPRAIARLVRRPAGVVVASSRGEVAALRALGLPAITADQALND